MHRASKSVTRCRRGFDPMTVIEGSMVQIKCIEISAQLLNRHWTRDIVLDSRSGNVGDDVRCGTDRCGSYLYRYPFFKREKDNA